MAAARPLLEEALAVAREIGNRRITAWALAHLGFVSYHLGDCPAARALGEESLALARALDERWGIAQREGDDKRQRGRGRGVRIPAV